MLGIFITNMKHETNNLEVSITKYLDKEGIIEFLKFLPQKYEIEKVQKLIKVSSQGKWLLWTRKHGLKILK